MPTTGPATAPVLPAWYGLHPVTPVLPKEKINDAIVEAALRRGVGYLAPRVEAGLGGEKGVGNGREDMELGVASLSTYALLHAGEALGNVDDIKPTSGPMAAALQRLKSHEVGKGPATYTISLRAQALGLAGRDADKTELGKDLAILLKGAAGGGYSYDPREANGMDSWDNSNSQYGLLGVWAASESGLPVPAKYWQDIEHHWVSSEVDGGGWAYEGHTGVSVPMTAAGVTSLSVAIEQDAFITSQAKVGKTAPVERAAARAKGPGGATVGPPPPTPQQVTSAIDRGLAVLAKGDTILQSGQDQGYTLYGVERAALATGFRFFGEHDWYRELGAAQIAQQHADGSWDDNWGGDVGTSFRLLFLARGRQPLLMNKLKFVGDWNDRPRDVAKLVAFASARLEKTFAWGVADLDRDWWTWLDAPMVMLTTDAAPEFTDAQVQKLRNYVDAGGFLLIHNEFHKPEVDAFARGLAKRMFPDRQLTPVPADDLLYHTLYPMKQGSRPPPELLAVSNGARPLIVYSPTDLSKAWLGFKAKTTTNDPALSLGLNLFVAAAGKRDFRNRLNTPYLDPSQASVVGTVPVQRITYPGGNADPEPGAWTRFGRWFTDQTSIAVDTQLTDVKAVSIANGPFATLTGTGTVDFTKVDVGAMQQFVRAGGTLLIDADGGDKAFVTSVRESLLPLAFGGISPAGMPLSHPILTGTGPCMTPLPPKPVLRLYASEQLGSTKPGVQYFVYGSGTVIVSDLDLTTALLHSSTYGVLGYAPEYADSLVKNALLWTLTRFQPPPPPPPATPAAGAKK